MDNNKKGFRMMLKWDKIPSVNKMYTRTRTGMTLSSEARKFKNEVAKQVRSQLPKTLPFGPNDVFKLSLQFILKTRFFVRDTSNFVKLVEDCIFDELDINDARNIELELKKSKLDKSKYEYIKVTVEKSDFNYNYFNEEIETDGSTGIELEDRMYSKDEMEDIYSKGLFDSLRWHLHKSLPEDEFYDQVKKSTDKRRKKK
jgi:hypothetical protein